MLRKRLLRMLIIVNVRKYIMMKLSVREMVSLR